MNMAKCEECGKTLGFFGSYCHPTMGKRHFLCSSCFDQVSESVEKWKNAVLPYVDFFNNCSSNSSFQSNWKNKLTDLIKIKKTIKNTRVKENYMVTEKRTLM